MWRSGPHAKIFKFVITVICDVTYSQATHMKKLTWNVSSVSSDYLALISLNINNIKWQIGLSASTHLWVLTFWFRFFYRKQVMTLWKTSITSKLLEIGNSFFHTRRARLRGVFSSNKAKRSHLTVMTLWFWQVAMLGQRRRRWTNNGPALSWYLVLLGTLGV